MTPARTPDTLPAKLAPQAARRVRLRQASRVGLALLMGGAGVLHFVAPAPFERMVPTWLPSPALLVAVSGVLEVLGAGGLLVPRTRRFASYGLVALLLAVFPANVNMTLHPEAWAIPVWALWLRLPLQALLIAWAVHAGREPAMPDATDGASGSR